MAGLLGAAAFGDLVQDVLGRDDAVHLDPAVMTFIVGHRVSWLTALMRVVTWLGSAAMIVPAVLAIGGYLLIRQRNGRPLARLVAAVAGAIALYDIVKPAVGRPRPPLADQIGTEGGWAFPSGHVTQSIAFYGMLAVMLMVQLSPKLRVLLGAGVALVTLMVSASRLYLGAHWFTDVLGGYALGIAWLAVVMVVTLLLSPSEHKS